MRDVDGPEVSVRNIKKFIGIVLSPGYGLSTPELEQQIRSFSVLVNADRQSEADDPRKAQVAVKAKDSIFARGCYLRWL